MIVTNCRIERTYNLGDYNSLKIGFDATLSEADKPLDVARDLELLCNQHYENRKPKTSQTTSNVTPAPTQPKPVPMQDTSKDGDTCPKCGKKKKPGYILCYRCYEEEKAQ